MVRCYHDDYKAGDGVFYRRRFSWVKGVVVGKSGRNRFLVADTKSATSNRSRYRRNIRPRGDA